MLISRPPCAEDRENVDPVYAIYAGITTRCKSAGLSTSEAEDIAQDVWEWLIRTGNMAAATVAPWLAAVTANFVRRYRRSRMREREVLQEFCLESPSKADPWPEQVEAKQFLDRLTSRSEECDRRLLDLLRQDLRLSEASTRLGIPKGSEQFRLRKLKKEAQRLRHPAEARRTAAT